MRTSKISCRMRSDSCASWQHSPSARSYYTLLEMLDVVSTCAALLLPTVLLVNTLPAQRQTHPNLRRDHLLACSRCAYNWINFSLQGVNYIHLTVTNDQHKHSSCVSQLHTTVYKCNKSIFLLNQILHTCYFSRFHLQVLCRIHEYT
jgi:hypothetical protein